jgi:hypothetical protein
MSGGHYDYEQSALTRIRYLMQEDLARIGTMNEWEETTYQLEPSTVDAIKLAMELLAITEKLVHDIDWCLSGDTGEDTLAKQMHKHRKDLNDLR